MDNEKIDFRLTPAATHYRNVAKRAINTLKYHIIAGLFSVNPNFSLYLWDKLIPQGIITQNILRQAIFNPQLSTYNQVHGSFDYNITLLGPPGTKVLTHLLPTGRISWFSYAIDGFYVGPEMRYYRCHNI